MRWFRVVDGLALGVAFGLMASIGGSGPAPMARDAPAPVAEAIVAPGADRFAFAPSTPLDPPQPTDVASAAVGQPAHVATTWSDAEVAAARARCGKLLKDIPAVVVAEPPFRHGACGSPAAVRLVSLGRSPQVAISPPALLTCEMVASLATWLDRDLQPLARKHLGGAIVTIETMSDYSCRTAYNRPETRLSEHSQANALDIRGFRTSRGGTAMVLANWGRTARETRALAAAATVSPFVTTVEQVSPPGDVSAGAKTKTATASAQGRTPAMAASVWGDAFSPKPPEVGFMDEGDGASGQAVSDPFGPRWLGGPKPAGSRKSRPRAGDGEAAAESGTQYAAFLHAAHRSACSVFRTALGPEANAAHRNHLHVDMAARKSGGYCR